jgi:hypothetical protein
MCLEFNVTALSTVLRKLRSLNSDTFVNLGAIAKKSHYNMRIGAVCVSGLLATLKKPRVMREAGILLFLRRSHQISRSLTLYHVTSIFRAPGQESSINIKEMRKVN